MKKLVVVAVCVSVVGLGGCMTAAEHASTLHSQADRNMTVGLVQKEIKKGITGAEVASILGAPNIVTTDERGCEVWIYDKISTDVSYSRSSVGGGLALLFGVGGGSGGVGGGPGVGGDSSAGASSKTQKTLTVVIKFDENKKVRDFGYHTSSF